MWQWEQSRRWNVWVEVELNVKSAVKLSREAEVLNAEEFAEGQATEET